MMQINGIPTIYGGYEMRSKNEATWAAFFDLCEWPWDYEAIELHGYLPDFVLKFARPIIVECKAGFSWDDLWPHTKKMEQSGWREEMLLVGSGFLKGEFQIAIGLLYQQGCEATDFEGCWAPGIIHDCLKCGKLSFYHEQWTWDCRVCRAYEGDGLLGPVLPYHLNQLWAEARNKVQWKPKNKV